jgi:hypothetical protein
MLDELKIEQVVPGVKFLTSQLSVEVEPFRTLDGDAIIWLVIVGSVCTFTALFPLPDGQVKAYVAVPLLVGVTL